MGLVQRVVEAAGVPTVSISMAPGVTGRLAPPRAISVRWPFGHPLGEPGAPLQHRRILWECMADLRRRPRSERGVVRALDLAWRRETYGAVDFAALDAPGGPG